MTNNNTTTESKTMTFSATAQKVIDWAVNGSDPFQRLIDAINSDRLSASVVAELESKLGEWKATTVRPFKFANELGV